MKKALISLLTLLICLTTLGQGMMYEVTLSDRVNQSTEIIEGKVISQESFWNDNLDYIYTASTIEVYKNLKGTVSVSELAIITPGGTVGLDRVEVHPALDLHVGDVGVFILKPNGVNCNNAGFTIPVFEPKASSQGFVEYDIREGIARDPFAVYEDIQVDVFDYIAALVGRPYIAVNRYDVQDEIHEASLHVRAGGHAITNISPTSANAGVGDVLTITGTGFGATQGSSVVEFRNANDGGAGVIEPLATQYVSWSNTQIQVEIPDDAGTGTVNVVVSAATETSTQTLNLSYAQLNAISDFTSPGTDYAYQTQHVDDDGAGGYTWRMHTDFDGNASANASFVRALDTWRCSDGSPAGTGIWWTVGATTTTDVAASDGINIVRFDNGGELPGGVLGRCTSYWSACSPFPPDWFVTELDIVFDDGTNWQYGPTAPSLTEYDFESVALHELGHGHQMGHVISVGAVMHYSISNGQSSRVLSFPDLTGASDVHTRSSTTTVCSESAMGTYTCGACTDPTIPTSISSTEGGSICNGESTTLSQVGGTLNDATAWTWYSGSCGGTLVGTGASIAVSPTTTTTYFVRGEGGCVTPGGCQSIVITVNSLPNGSASVTNATCNGGSDGAIDLTPSGTPIFTYDWDNDGTGDFDDPQDLTGLPAGNYNVTIRDGAGCEATEGPYSVTEPSAVSYTVNITNETCATNDGELDFTGTGGSGSGYNYDFDGGGYSATSTYAGLAAGSYSIQVRDGLGCESTVGNETVTDVCGLQTQLVPADCGASYGTLDEWLNWDAVTGATQYLIRLTPQGGGTALLKVRTNLKVKMLAFGSIEYNTTYDVDINAYVGGAWIGYGPVCEITTPATLPTTMLQPAYCNQTLTSMTAFIRWDAVPGANNYHIQMIESGGGPSMNKFKAGTKVRPSQFAGIQTSTTYDVKIRAYDGTTWGPWGTVCTITTPSSFTNTEIEAMMLDNDFGQPNEHRLDIVETDWSFSLYPNPNDGDLAQFSLELDESIANDITVDVMDMSGRTLYTKEYQTSEGTGYYNALINFEGTLADGLYIVNITVNGVTQSEKLVVKK